MSIRKEGVYTTAFWDYGNMKAHFLYDKYTCDTHPLTDFEGAPIFFFEYKNEQAEIDYFFIPIVRVLESPLYTKDVKPVANANETIKVRNQPAWQWTGRIEARGRSSAIDVFYSVATETAKLRVRNPLLA